MDCSFRVTTDGHTKCVINAMCYSQVGYDPLACSACAAWVQEFRAASPEVMPSFLPSKTCGGLGRVCVEAEDFGWAFCCCADSSLSVELDITRSCYCSFCISEPWAASQPPLPERHKQCLPHRVAIQLRGRPPLGPIPPFGCRPKTFYILTPRVPEAHLTFLVVAMAGIRAQEKGLAPPRSLLPISSFRFLQLQFAFSFSFPLSSL